jgi:crotonobetainyl-CoA:carnitine CoA-transferase CaiB-like acyl-CoA transferase
VTINLQEANMSHINVDQWVELFRAVGLTDEQMRAWHDAFEERHPEGHQSFLQWLGLPAERIARIRSRTDHDTGA